MQPLELILTRTRKLEDRTFGEIKADNKLICYTVEDKDRGLKSSMSLEEIAKIKVPKQTCVTSGRFRIVITQSARFSKYYGKPIFLPLLLEVPGFDGIRLHKGVKPEDTEGCILPLTMIRGNTGYDSTSAYNKLFKLIQDAINAGREVYITII